MANMWENPEFVKKAAIAKEKAWTNFLNHFPKAEKSRFVSQESIDEKNNATAGVFQRKRRFVKKCLRFRQAVLECGNETSTRFGRQRRFSLSIVPLGSKVSLPIPAEPFDGKAPRLKKIFNAKIKIYVTPDQYFTTKFRDIFQKTKLRHTSGAKSKHWLGGPDMKYWSQTALLKSLSADKSFLCLPRVFHGQAHFVPARRYSEYKRFARRPDVQSNE